jgi:glycosyltransferase involved in cell wall biosynthesis
LASITTFPEIVFQAKRSALFHWIVYESIRANVTEWRRSMAWGLGTIFLNVSYESAKANILILKYGAAGRKEGVIGKMAQKRPIVCLAAIDWSYLWHRPQQLMLRLAQSGHPVHYRNPVQVSGKAREEVAPHLWVYYDFGQLPEAVEAAIYFVYFPAYAGWLEPGGEKFIIYDCIDDDPVFDGSEALMLSRADLVICVSQSLMAKHRPQHSRLMLLSNGVDLQHYQSGNFAVPEELRRYKQERQILLGFTGAFYRGWVDMELLYQIAAVRPEWRIVIIGESYQWNFSGAPSNLVYLGPRPYAQLPGYVRCFDVGLIPFVDNRIAQGADPVKLYEYAAAGIPVVSRNLPFVRDLQPPLVYRYDNLAECLNAVKRALFEERRQPHLVKMRRREFAAGHTWDRQIGLLLAELEQLTWLERS